jgi:hypothetical protein
MNCCNTTFKARARKHYLTNTVKAQQIKLLIYRINIFQENKKSVIFQNKIAPTK